MGGAPYIRPRLGGGPIFEVSVSYLDVSAQASYQCYLLTIRIVTAAATTINFTLIQAR